MMTIYIKVHGLGNSIDKEMTAEDGVTCSAALEMALAGETDLQLTPHLVYMVNGMRAFPDTVLAGGDVLTVVAPLGGG